MLTEEVTVTDVEVTVNTYSLFSVVEMAYIWSDPSHPTWLMGVPSRSVFHRVSGAAPLNL
jgi:hypothetical protein